MSKAHVLVIYLADEKGKHMICTCKDCKPLEIDKRKKLKEAEASDATSNKKKWRSYQNCEGKDI